VRTSYRRRIMGMVAVVLGLLAAVLAMSAVASTA
jgi:hypothetical protein